MFAEQRMWSAVAARCDECDDCGTASHRFSTVIGKGTSAFSGACSCRVPRGCASLRSAERSKAVARLSAIVTVVAKRRHRTPHALLRDPLQPKTAAFRPPFVLHVYGVTVNVTALLQTPFW